MQQPGVNGQSESYRYGFQGQEHDDEITGTQSHYAYEYRMNDARLGRFLSLDPLSAKYPYNSPYAFSENRVIDGVELEGLEVVPCNEVWQIQTPDNRTGVTASGIPSVDESSPGKWGKIDGQNVMLREITEGPNKGNYVGTIYYENGTYLHSAYVVGGDLIGKGPLYGSLQSNTSSEYMDQVVKFNFSNKLIFTAASLYWSKYKNEDGKWLYQTDFVNYYGRLYWDDNGQIAYDPFYQYTIETEVTDGMHYGLGAAEFLEGGGVAKIIEFEKGMAKAAKLYPKKAGKIELHHIVPKYLGGAKNGALAPIDAAYHQLITNEFRALWPYGKGVPSAEDLQFILKQVYEKYPLPLR